MNNHYLRSWRRRNHLLSHRSRCFSWRPSGRYKTTFTKLWKAKVYSTNSWTRESDSNNLTWLKLRFSNREIFLNNQKSLTLIYQRNTLSSTRLLSVTDKSTNKTNSSLKSKTKFSKQAKINQESEQLKCRILCTTN
jgi:hypothetical protein